MNHYQTIEARVSGLIICLNASLMFINRSAWGQINKQHNHARVSP